MAEETTQPAEAQPEQPAEQAPITAQEIDPQAARQVLDAEKKMRAERCKNRIIQVLNEENCRAEPQIVITGNQITYAGIDVSAYDGIPGIPPKGGQA